MTISVLQDFRRITHLNLLDAQRSRGLFSFSNMSDKTTTSPENSSEPIAESAPRARRISTPRPKKVAKKSGTVKSAAVKIVEDQVSIPFPSPPKREEPIEASAATGGDWPESEAESVSGSQSQTTESAKRKRRRRKGKGQGNSPQNIGEESTIPTVSELKSPEPTQEQRPRPQAQQPPRPKIDPEVMTKMAWKIYLAEVSEEGVALIGDNDAKDLSRRCFRLAEIFIEEQMRRR
jgi:hypothetical protein